MVLSRCIAILSLTFALTACESNEDRAEAAYQRGIELLEAGDEDRAQVEFRNAVRLNRTHVQSHLNLGRLNLEDGSLRPAFRSYTMVVENEPDNAEALTALSQIAFLSNDWESFERYATRAVEVAPDSVETRIIDLANRYRKSVVDEENLVRAQLLAQATELHDEAPDDKLLRRVLIDGNLQEGNFEAALQQIDKEIEDNPKDREIYELKVRILAQLGDNIGVEDELRRMVEVFPNDEEIQSFLVRALMSRGKVDEAEAFLRERIARAGDGDDEPYMSLVQFLKVQHGFDAALAELEKQIASRPDSHSLRMMRALMNFEAGNADIAIAEMQDLISREAGSENFTVAEQQRYKGILAKMLSQNGNEVGARRLVEEILEQDSSDSEALKMQARWYVRDDDTNAAITALRTAMAENPNDPEALTIMAWAYERAGDTQLMQDFLSLAVEASNNAPDESMRYANALLAEGRNDQAEEILLSALRLQPSNPELLTNLGRFYLRQRDLPRARQVGEALRRIDTQLAQAAADGIELELIAQEQGTQEALDYLGEMAQSEDADQREKMSFLRGLLQDNQIDRAAEFVAELTEQEPDNDSYQYFLGVVQAAQSQFDEAKSTLNALTERSPKVVPAWQLLARLQAASGNPETAAATLERALTHVPGSAELLWARASYFEIAGQIDDAISIYEKLYELNSDSVIAANNLASMISTYKTDPESLVRARSIARRLKDSEIPAFQDTYGWILYRSGEVEAAMPYLERAAEGLGDDPLVQVHLGRAYLSQGRLDEARQQLDRARAAAGPLANASVKENIESFEQTLAQN